MPNFADRLADAIDRAGAPACVGLDPVLDRLPRAVRDAATNPVGAIEAFCHDVIVAIAGVVPAVKFQSACFERYGAPGVGALHRLMAAARHTRFLVLLDAKRGDIGITAEHYAAAAFDGPAPADALTLSGYLGPDTIEPFLGLGRGVFVLVRTSNPGSDAVQAAKLADGRTVAEMMADTVAGMGASRRGRRGLSSVGAVVGATKAAEGRALRTRMPDQVFLVPGYGAQGGTLDDVRALIRPTTGAPPKPAPGDLGVLVTASRSVLYPPGSADAPEWVRHVRDAATQFVAELRAL